MSNTTTRKTTKSELKTAVDSFFWFLGWITGGTMEETLKQADFEIGKLEEKAAEITRLAANPAKPCAGDSHLMERAASVNARVENYRTRYVGKLDAWLASEGRLPRAEMAMVQAVEQIEAFKATPATVKQADEAAREAIALLTGNGFTVEMLRAMGPVAVAKELSHLTRRQGFSIVA